VFHFVGVVIHASKTFYLKINLSSNSKV